MAWSSHAANLDVLKVRPSDKRSPHEQGALRSAIASKQWTQCRLHSAGLASSQSCLLCVQPAMQWGFGNLEMGSYSRLTSRQCQH